MSKRLDPIVLNPRARKPPPKPSHTEEEVKAAEVLLSLSKPTQENEQPARANRRKTSVFRSGAS